jgi:hypothetical protein
MAKGAAMGERFMETLCLYLRLEEDQGYQGGGLNTVHRPEEIKLWYKRRHAVWYPPIQEDVSRFAQEFKLWFHACSPAWRVPKNGSLPMVRRSDGDWTGLRVLGPNGIVAFLVALIWWQQAIQKCKEGSRAKELQSRFNASFDEVEYSLQGISGSGS